MWKIRSDTIGPDSYLHQIGVIVIRRKKKSKNISDNDRSNKHLKLPTTLKYLLQLKFEP